VDYEAIHTKQIRSDLLDSLMKRFGDLVKNEVFVVATFLDPYFGFKAFPKNQKCLGACTNTDQSNDEHK
jgi:hypothetical protein